MQIQKVGAAAAAQRQQNVNNDNNGIVGAKDFYRLLVAQIKHQDPTKPMDASQTITQMAQISASQATLETKGAVMMISAQNKIQLANSMIGKYAKIGGKKGVKPQVHKVDGVRFDGRQLKIIAGGKEFDASRIISVGESAAALSSAAKKK